MSTTTPPSKSAARSARYLRRKSPYRKISSDQIDYGLACTVIDSWDKVTRARNWSETSGEVFLRRLFEISPKLREIWGFGGEEAKLHGAKFIQKGAALLLAVDKAVHFIGPDLEPLEAELFALGRRHIHMGAEPEYWPLVGDALMFTLKAGLGDDFSEFEEEAWTTIYDFMAYWMIEGLIAEKMDRWEAEEEPPALVDLSRSGSEDTQGISRCGSEVSLCSMDGDASSSRRSPSSGMDRSSVSIADSMNMGRATRRGSMGSLGSLESYATCNELDDSDVDLNFNLYDEVPVDQIDFTTVQLVMDSWHRVISKPTWQKDSAVFCLTRLFDLVPDLKTAWGFARDFDPEDTSDPDHRRFVHKGIAFMGGIDKAVAFIGPDLEPLEMELKDLGRIHHLHMGAQPQFWPPVGIALLDTLENILGPENFDNETRSAWGLIYHFMAYWMIEGLLAEKRGELKSPSYIIDT